MLMSAVLVGFVPVSKLNAFGLSECGEAVVELANHSFESVAGFVVVVVEPLVDVEFVADIALFVFVPVWPPAIVAALSPFTLPVVLLPADSVVVVPPPLLTLTWPNAIAIGLGDESGDDVSDDIFATKSRRNNTITRAQKQTQKRKKYIKFMDRGLVKV